MKPSPSAASRPAFGPPNCDSDPSQAGVDLRGGVEHCQIDSGLVAADVHGMSRGARPAVVVLLVARRGVLWWRETHRTVPVPPPTAAPPAAPPPAPPPPPPARAIRNPVPAAAAPGGLPSLDQSDGYVKKSL